MEKEKKGKKIAAIIALAALVIIILLCLVRCQPGGSEDPTEGTTNTTAATDEATETTGEPATETTDPTTETTVSSTDVTEPSTEPTTPGSDLPTIESTEPVETEPQPTEHTHSYTKTTTAPSCTAEGYTTYNCECGDSYIDDYTAAMGHTWGEWITTKEPTETATGEAQRKCGRCMATETKVLDKVIPDHTHSYSEKVTKAATCTAEGVKTFTCSCGGSYTESISKVAHSYKAAVTAPTCTTKGYTVHTCTACGDSYTDSYTEAKGHSYKSVVTAPTCTEGGYTTYTCSVCKDSYKSNTVKATGHSYTSKVTTEATCTKAGVKTYTCSACSDKYTESVPAVGHNYSSVVTAPTCTAEGYTTYTCSVCRDSYKSNTVKATGHSYSSKTTKSATCTADGVKTYTCSSCRDSYTEAITKLGHNYSEKVTSPTCTAKGYTTYTCNRCGDYYKGNYTNAKGHSWGEWYTTKEPTETSTGTAERKCSVCSIKETKTLEKLEAECKHDYVIMFIPATCISDGYYRYACKLCGYSYNEFIYSKSDEYHKYSLVSSVSGDCSTGKNGSETYKCSTCGDSYTKTTSPHNWNHIHTDEVGHYEWYAICHCGGWKWNVADGDPTPSYQNHRNKVLEETGTTAGHSYYSDDFWVVDTPASDKWVCEGCGEVVFSKP